MVVTGNFFDKACPTTGQTNMSKRTKTTVTFSVTVQLPKGVTIPQMQAYIRDAVGGWKGGMSPSEFDDLDVFTVGLVKRITTYG